MTELETAVNLTIKVFAQCSSIEGSSQNLTKRELKTLPLAGLNKGLPGTALSGRNKGAIDKLVNGDDQVDFREFRVLMAELPACHKSFVWAEFKCCIRDNS
uniref:S100/CaBP-9k-type calcium binding subdomain domain-containing protein n=1 Tax=Castor canadensis TaxID=51338 RepID=A0A8C0XRY7_CASCN